MEKMANKNWWLVLLRGLLLIVLPYIVFGNPGDT
jgi:uncharacterized membrane protein HdeD (DUF308 family)